MTITTTTGARIRPALAAMNDRSRALDPQLPDRAFDDDDPILAALDGDAVRAVGRVSVAHLAQDQPAAIWGALHRAELELGWSGDAGAMGELLDAWLAEAAERMRRAGADATTDWETSCSLRVPARDSAAVKPLLARGFAVVGVEGIRVGSRGADGEAAQRRLSAAGVRLRPARLDDLALLTELDTELFAHDAQHGSITRRPQAGASLRAGIEARLHRDPEWTWIVECGDDQVGYVSLETDRAEHLGRVAPGADIAFLQAMYLRPEVRGSRIGEAVVEFAHARLEERGYDRVLLDYAALNPRSGPFWCRMGYRPLWNLWQRRPAG
ncbi:GNAT family N-acetyltransferase [Agromyces larvae]|uniref:GNAT family N-acetyltransferase n=1 Tax=Agromyces larvae TaxID=2929802 RepID=A0ABY4BYY3_9MICO|nr:GNAT family N-acetyltransferase [Agromyces larvae]UOE44392.1 GNAT family N-acetyltransferase [Agromyces larvae]